MPKRLALLDLYAGKSNEGIRCIHELAVNAGLNVQSYEVRLRGEFPEENDFDLLISSGGPGDPHEVSEMPWGEGYRQLFDNLIAYNENNTIKKHAFLICHSFQMACIMWDLAEVTLRRKPAFGIYPVEPAESGKNDPIFRHLPSPFYVIDSRDWQVIEPDYEAMHERGAQVLAIERERPHVPLERATMAIRFTPEIIGTQFHPEGDESSIENYLADPERRAKLLETHDEERLAKVASHLGDPSKVQLTNSLVIPKFFEHALSINV